ncbi:xanthine dehydrogenase [Plutella xylostella]|uniref:xanthine dehydrogenase n=1 Tax=Plutella xylostella TaxID=51655 RepID=UPI002032F80F|nr:xanthine dehydrogenase [Plutella xylostella]
MCREGGCGACVVAVSARDPADLTHRTFSVNSCLISITQCQDWEITTVEGLGDRRRGYHPVQRALAEHNGSQCGYCSPSWVMSMYSLLESHHYDLTQYQIEDSFGSNTCRCTGYRPILDAFKSFAKDAPKPKELLDIEDLSICKKKGDSCQKTCEKKHDWCWVNKEDAKEKAVKKIKLKDAKMFYKVYEVKDIFNIFHVEGVDSYMLIGGNTGKGAYHIFEYPRVLVDVSDVTELRRCYLDQNLVVGGATTLTDLMRLLADTAGKYQEFRYLQKLYEHLNLVAHIPVRNVGTVAGNLMVKHRVNKFSSDIFLLLETIRATLTIWTKSGKVLEVTPKEFLYLDMTGSLIVNVKIPPLSDSYHFVSFKIMPRAQNAHASVNAGFLYKFDEHEYGRVESARIVMGGISERFVHAENTEKFLVGKQLFTNEVLQAALQVLADDLVVEEIAGELKPEFRKKLALGLFYKACLTLIPEHYLKPRYRSGRRDFRKTRPVSAAESVIDSNPAVWPLTEPMPKMEALIQCAGEIKYSNDEPRRPNEVHAAFVTSDVPTGEIIDIDPTPALKLPGVLKFFTAKDIPGRNNFMSLKIGPPLIFNEEEILCDGKVKCYDQAIGIIVAETEALAQRAALLVQVRYKRRDAPPLLTVAQVRRGAPERVQLYSTIPARARGADVRRVLRGQTNIESQFFFSMEPLTCVAWPSDDGVFVNPSCHSPDLTQIVIAECLNIPQSRVLLRAGPVGGSYGSRLTRAAQVSTACSLVSYLMNRPARLVLSIQQSMRVSGSRLPCTRDFECGVNDEGEIQYLEYQLYENNGWVFGDPIVSLALLSVRNAYDDARWNCELYNVMSDNISYSWCRAPGSVEAIAMSEYIMEQIAYELDLDPLEVRMRNLRKNDPPLEAVVKQIIEDSEYYKRKEEVRKFNSENRWKKKALRVALMSFPSVLYSDFQVLLTLYHGDGSLVVQHGGVEVGQGINTKVAQAVAYTLQVPLSQVRVKAMDNASNPNTNQTGNSTTSETCCFGAIKCCQLLLDRLADTRARLPDASWAELAQAAYKAGVNLQTSYHTTANDTMAYRVPAAAVAEVELDVLTGEHELLRVDLLEDAGTSINPELDIGQVEGGFIMGLGYWTSEHMIYSARSGELLTDRTWYYHVPQAKDIPLDFRVKLQRNSYNPAGILGSKVVGEPPTCLGVVAGLALHAAIAASRWDSGAPKTEWFEVDGAYTIEANVLTAGVKLHEFLYN